MKPVNLLPNTERPAVAAVAPKNASIAVIGTLALVLLAVAMYVLTGNGISDKRAKIAEAKSEQAQATRLAAGLKAYGDFRQVKQVRVDSVKELAGQRFDWERFMRELALVLPSDVWLTEATSSQNGSSNSSATSSASPPSDTSTAASGPSIQLTGCAKKQEDVAETMARVRNLHGAEDVQLGESTKPKDGGGNDSGGSSSDSSGDGNCGSRYKFTATVQFATPSQGDDSARKAPSRLGGGA